MKLVWQCLFSPRLYKVYRDGPMDNMYQPQRLEKWGDKIILMANTLLNITLYTSPFVCLYIIYKHGFFTIAEMRSFGQALGGFGCLVALSLIMRGYGRANNPQYVSFLKALNSPMTDKKAYLTELRKYDFEARAWPVTYNVAIKESGTKDPIIKMDPIHVGTSWMDRHPFKACANPQLPLYQRATIQILAFVATHTFGLRLIYPGSIGFVHTILWDTLFQGRTTLVETHNAQRTRLGTADGNIIDTMFVDNRGKTSKGAFLVVSCEGNSGFYEIGIMNTPIKAGYSALGWNHPGFAGSTGLPYPSQEQNAIDAVMQFAINELGFQPGSIVMFGWSIGGYTATWAAVNYPVRALILDATFDDLLPLAENQMPRSWSLLVKEVIRSYVNLNIVELIANYDGPVQLIRRTNDEIICLRQGVLSSNRGNHLLMSLIDQRHHDDVENSAAQISLGKLVALVDAQRSAIVRIVAEHERPLLLLISKYMRDYKSTHCTPLPESDFSDIMNRIEASK